MERLQGWVVVEQRPNAIVVVLVDDDESERTVRLDVE